MHFENTLKSESLSNQPTTKRLPDHILCQWWNQDFRPGGAVHVNLLFGHTFLKTAWKWRQMGQRGASEIFPCPPLSGNFSEHWIINFIWFAKNSIGVFLFHGSWNFQYSCISFDLVFVHGLICMLQKYTKQVRPSSEWMAMGPIIDSQTPVKTLPFPCGQ